MSNLVKRKGTKRITEYLTVDDCLKLKLRRDKLLEEKKKKLGAIASIILV